MPRACEGPAPRPLRHLPPLFLATTLALGACGPDVGPTGPGAAEAAVAAAPVASPAATPLTATLDLRARVTAFDGGEGVARVLFDGTTSEGLPLTGKGTMRFTAEPGPSPDVLLVKTAELRFRGTLGSDGSAIEIRGEGGLALEDILVPRAGIVFLPITEFKGDWVPR